MPEPTPVVYLRPGEKTFDSPEGGDSFSECVGRVLDFGPMMRLDQVVTQLDRPDLGRHGVDE